jgi:hypothetical protein
MQLYRLVPSPSLNTSSLDSTRKDNGLVFSIITLSLIDHRDPRHRPRRMTGTWY